MNGCIRAGELDQSHRVIYREKLELMVDYD